MSEIKLHPRYPNSRTEDIVDAHMHGFAAGYEFAEDEIKKLQELAKYAILCSEGDVRCEACPYHDKTAEPHIICTMRKAAIELGVELPA